MGLMDKVKKILFDEDIIEVPVESEELPERAPKTRMEREEKKGFIDYTQEENEEVEEENPIKEIIIPKEEKKEEKGFVFPDVDLDFELPSRVSTHEYVEEPPVREKRVENPFSYASTVKEEKKTKTEEVKDYRKMLSETNKEADKKPFKVTPIISPVYGILDKNYTPENVAQKKEVINQVNNGISPKPRSFGPVSYNDRPLPTVNKKETTLKEDLVELNTTISELINDSVTHEDLVVNVPKTNISYQEPIVEKEELPEEEDAIIQTENYDAFETSGIENEYIGNTNIEDAFETTSEFDRIAEEDSIMKEEVPLSNELDDEDAGLDNTIETDLFNLIDSMYKDDEKEGA